MKERFKLIPEVFFLLVKEDKVLLASRFNTGYEDGNYNMVAGHVDGKETMREAMVREAKEEAGITIVPADLKHLLTMHRWCEDMGGHERIGFYFTADKWEGEITNTEPDKCDDLSWFSLADLPKNMTPHIRHAIDSHLKGLTYTEFNWENKI